MQKFNTYGGAKKTPQSQPIPKKKMVINNAGGYVFQISDIAQFKRFLILGTEGGSYYRTEREMTLDNCKTLEKLLSAGKGKEVIDVIIDVSDRALAPKNDAAIFSLAVIMALGDNDAKKYASENLHKICRIGTHILQFASYVDGLRGYGKTLRKAIIDWYVRKPAEKLAFQVLKYGNRAGWTHKDVFRMVHPKPEGAIQEQIFKYLVKGDYEKKIDEKAIELINTFEEIKKTDNEKTILDLIEKYKLPMEFIPTEKRSKKVWNYIIPNAGMTFLLRNLGNMSKSELLHARNTELIKTLKDKFTDPDTLQKARIHPINILVGMMTYQSGRGLKGSGVWTPVQKIVDALDEAFYASFKYIEPSGKNILLGLDVSGSMSCDSVMGIPDLTPRAVSTAMAMATMRTEENWHVMGFTGGFVELKISPRQRLDDIMRYTSKLGFDSTDCALPMLYALKNNIKVDLFAIYTDNETWVGRIHPKQALDEYRQKMGINSRVVVAGTTATNFSIADPSDLGMLDVVGFDSNTPSIISSFSRGDF
jgi:60 kDa SS-A/Ro ribonucleoprotein